MTCLAESFYDRIIVCNKLKLPVFLPGSYSAAQPTRSVPTARKLASSAAPRSKQTRSPVTFCGDKSAVRVPDTAASVMTHGCGAAVTVTATALAAARQVAPHGTTLFRQASRAGPSRGAQGRADAEWDQYSCYDNKSYPHMVERPICMGMVQ